MRRHRRSVSWVLVLAACLWGLPPTLSAADNLEDILEGFEAPATETENALPAEDALDDVLEGFDDTTDHTPAPMSGASGGSGIFSIDGRFKLGSTVNFAHSAPRAGKADWRGLSRLRPELQLDLNARFSNAWQALVSARGFFDAAYTIKGRANYTDQVLDAYEDEADFKEIYLLGRLSRALDVKLGRQIVVWGKSDSIRVTDVLNPLDNREPGLTDIEDLRLAVFMTKLDYYVGSWNISGISIPEIRFDKNPVFGHDFFPVKTPLPPADKPATSWGNAQWATSARGIFDGWDVDLYYARLFDRTFHIVPAAMPGTFVRQYPRISMYGADYNRALGNFLLKAEAALLSGLVYTNTPGKVYDRVDILVGMEYSGFKETTVTLEVVNRHVRHHTAALKEWPDGVCADMYQGVVRFARDFWHDTLTVNFLGSFFGPSEADGAFQRLDMVYDLSDMQQIRAGLVFYQSGDRPLFSRWGNNDRFFFEYIYNF